MKFSKFALGVNDSNILPLSSGNLSLKKNLLTPSGQQIPWAIPSSSRPAFQTSPTRPTQNNNSDGNSPRPSQRGKMGAGTTLPVPESWLNCFPIM